MSHVPKFVADLNQEKRTAKMNLFGSLGTDVNGHYFAADLAWLGDQVDDIEILINSEGGSVFQGLSIVNAIRNVNANVTAKIEGLALSMAGFLAVTCDRVEMSDFSRLMVHDPFMAGKKSLTEKEQKGLDNIKAILNKILAARSGKTAEEVAKIMGEETWYTAEEALEAGLIDKVITTGINIEASSNDFKQVREAILQAAAQLHQSINQTENTMKDLAAHFGLQPEATQEDILAKVQDIQASLETAQSELQAAQKANEALTAQVTARNQEIAAVLVDTAIAQGKIKSEAREKMVQLATESRETFTALIQEIPGRAAKIFTPQAAKTEGGEDRTKWTYDDFQKKDPEALTEMMASEPDRFQALFAAQYGAK
jgi:ATP-dependent Clp endopeptidase proteolytic subunit ClpP